MSGRGKGAKTSTKAKTCSTSKSAASANSACSSSAAMSVVTCKPSAGAKDSAKDSADPCPEKCAVCEGNIIDGKDQALYCEGLCKSWFHRCCAGVSAVHFEALSSCSDPFICSGCFQKNCKEEMNQLRSTISSLREEVTQLHKALNEKHANGTVTTCFDGCWERYRGGGHGARGGDGSRGRGGGRGRGRGGGQGGGRGGGRGRGRGGTVGYDGRVNNGGQADEAEDGGASIGKGGCGDGSGGGGDTSGGVGGGSSSASTRRKKTTDKVQVEGARRIWGTLKVTTATSLKYTISKFHPTTSIQIKRKTVLDDVGSTKRWWFVLHAPESVLLGLENVWEKLQLQTGWKLEPCFRPHQPVAESIISCVTPDFQPHTESNAATESNDSIPFLEN